MDQEVTKQRISDMDVLLIIRTQSDYFATLHFEAYRLPDGHYELNAGVCAWDHKGDDTLIDAVKTMKERAGQLGIPDELCESQLHIKCNPLAMHQILIRRWSEDGITESLLRKDSQFDGQPIRSLIKS